MKSERDPDLPSVSIIILTYNEQDFITRCLDSILSLDYPKDLIEVIVVDGKSEDGTREIVKSYIGNHPNIRLLENPKRINPAGRNLGIKNSSGDLVAYLVAHSEYDRMYFRKIVSSMKEYGVSCAGGMFKIVPRKASFIGRTIAYALQSRLCAGNALFKVGVDKPVKADAVAFLVCERKVFDEVGLYDERFERAQDTEFNLRLKKAGYDILLVPDTYVTYFARSDLIPFIKHYFKQGRWITYRLGIACISIPARHLAPLFFVLGILASSIISLFSWYVAVANATLLSVYLAICLMQSVKISIEKRDLRFVFSLALIFPLFHFVYGFGSVVGLIQATFKRVSNCI